MPAQIVGEAQPLRVGIVSPPFFEVYGVRATAGRTFARDEDQPGKEKVTVLTHRAWSSLFGGEPIPSRAAASEAEPVPASEAERAAELAHEPD